MYRFPADLQINEIIGESITQWCLSRHSASFSLGAAVFSVESMLSLERDGNTFAQWWGNQSFDIGFFDALDQKVVSYKVPTPDTLLINLENGITMRIMDTSDQYESVQINIRNGKTFVI